MGTTEDDRAQTTRRALLAGVGAAGVSVTLAACAGSDSVESSGAAAQASDGAAARASATAPAMPMQTREPAVPASPQRTAEATPTGRTGNGGGGIRTSDIPVNGGKIFYDTDTVVTQPVRGTFKAFSATCTHMGCPVASVANNTIACTCHGSGFDAANGSVVTGPATEPLTPKRVTVSGSTIIVS